MKLVFALLARSAERGENGGISLLGGGFDTIQVSELPGRVGPWAHVSRIEVSNVEANYVAKLELLAPDGERSTVIDHDSIHVKPFTKYPRDTTGLSLIFQFPLEVKIEGLHQLILSVNDNEFPATPLHVVLVEPAAE